MRGRDYTFWWENKQKILQNKQKYCLSKELTWKFKKKEKKYHRLGFSEFLADQAF